MLVLSRRSNEAILLGSDVRVIVLGVDGGTVKLGIEAPRSMAVTREELLLDTAKSNKESARRRPDSGSLSFRTTKDS